MLCNMSKELCVVCNVIIRFISIGIIIRRRDKLWEREIMDVGGPGLGRRLRGTSRTLITRSKVPVGVFPLFHNIRMLHHGLPEFRGHPGTLGLGSSKLLGTIDVKVGIRRVMFLIGGGIGLSFILEEHITIIKR